MGALTLPVPALDILPHRPPMVFVDELTERYDDTAVASVKLDKDAICFHRTPAGVEILPEVYVEIIAQTAALANGYDARCQGKKMKDGMLVGIDSFTVTAVGEMFDRLVARVEKVFEFDALTIIQGRIFHGEELVAEGKIKVWENPEP